MDFPRKEAAELFFLSRKHASAGNRNKQQRKKNHAAQEAHRNKHRSPRVCH
jgi:hypothetical protein